MLAVCICHWLLACILVILCWIHGAIWKGFCQFLIKLFLWAQLWSFKNIGKKILDIVLGKEFWGWFQSTGSQSKNRQTRLHESRNSQTHPCAPATIQMLASLRWPMWTGRNSQIHPVCPPAIGGPCFLWTATVGQENHMDTPLWTCGHLEGVPCVDMQAECKCIPTAVHPWPVGKPQCNRVSLGTCLVPYCLLGSLGSVKPRLGSGAWPIPLHCRGVTNVGSAGNQLVGRRVLGSIPNTEKKEKKNLAALGFLFLEPTERKKCQSVYCEKEEPSLH